MNDQRVGMMLWRGKYLILVAVIAMVVVAIVVTLVSSKSYEASALLRVDQAAAPANGSDAFNAQQASATQAVGFATLMTSTSFLQRIAPKIDNGFAFSGADLERHLGASAIKGTNLIAVTFTAGSRKDALHYARTVADQAIAAFSDDFVATRTRQQAAVQARITSVAAQIASLQGVGTPDAQQQIAALQIALTDLTAQYGQAVSESSAPTPVVQVAGPPSAPASPVSPRPLLNLGIAVFLGLLVGIGLAWVRDRLTSSDRRTASLSQALARDPRAAAAPARAGDGRKASQ